jgi:DNA invertase Pin-like site-specific DNA recombinase
MNKIKKIFLYCRVSTGMQQTGLESQVRALREYCKRFNLTNYEIFEDENQSGTKKSRPALDEMMKRVRSGDCEKVIVYSFSRFARSVSHLLSALQEFENLGVKFISMSESIDTGTPIGRALFTILGSVAQLERDLIAERVKNGLANAKAKGIHIGRHKLRDSNLIRKLLATEGMTYREAARISRCSTGAISAEVKEIKAEALERAKKIALEEALMPKLELDNEKSFESNSIVTERIYQGQVFNFSSEEPCIELER